VKLVPGTKITCKKQLEFNCARGAYDTMECGPATAARYGYKPKPQNDETTEAGDAPEQRQAPVSGEPAMKLQPEAPPAAPRAPAPPVAPGAPVPPTAPTAPTAPK
jgi:levansucrase